AANEIPGAECPRRWAPVKINPAFPGFSAIFQKIHKTAKKTFLPSSLWKVYVKLYSELERWKPP
ncbi:MAG: hypothetical protein KAI73_10835, partial [Rhodospirillaceae bacterium]|nr:hypothetical protein [Rhodospirillaceae bacterium]